MDYRILGTLEVKDGDRLLAVGGEKQRALLAVLLLHAGEVVSADRLIDELWGERAPPGAPKALQAHISRLRKALDTNGAPATDGEPTETSPDGVLVTRGHGYLLRVATGELDLDRFRAVAEEGRRALAAGDPERAADKLRMGLELWRGPPLADFAYEAFAQVPIAELEELRLAAVEDRVEADLALGRHEQLVGELGALVKHNRLRERLRMQLMLALYRCGRQAEALDVYQEYRRGLADELGLDPSPRIQQLETAILARDPALDLADARHATTVDASGASARGPVSVNRRRLRLALVAAIMVALAALVLVMTSTGGGRSRSVLAVDSVGAISPSGGSIVGQTPVGSSPTSLAGGDGAVWAATSDNTVSRIDPRSHAVQSIPVGSGPSAIAVGAGAVWVANSLSGTVSRISPAVNRVVGTVPVGNGPTGVAVGDGSVWVTNSSDGTLSRIDPNTDIAHKPIPLGGGVDGVATGYRSVWVSDETEGRVLRINPENNQISQPIPVGTGPTAIAAGDGAVWVTNSQDGTVSKINPQTNTVASTITVGAGPDAIAVGAGGVWVANEFGDNLLRIDPATDTVARLTRLGNSPLGLAISIGQLWVGAQAPVTSHRGGTLVVVSHLGFGSLDPASPNNGGSLDSGYMFPLTRDGLTTFKRVGGSAGVQVVPDLAVSLPTPTDGERIYTFTLRRGIRYSNGQPVRPEDFRHELERQIALNPGLVAAELGQIVGVARCLAHPKQHCNLGHGVVADDAANTVTFHLVRPDPEFLDLIYIVVAVPAGTPLRDVGTHPVPGTGPYEYVKDTGREVVLVRNPYFHQWSQAAQPDGYPDRIIWRLGGSVDADVTAVEHNHADYTLDPPPPDRLQEVQTRYANQVNINPNIVTAASPLNTRVAPFNDIRVRRALNYAVDRAKVARLLGVDSTPTCQMLPPYIPGYKPYCPYTLDPTAKGGWRAPDMAKARALIAASGTRGDKITIFSSPSLIPGPDFDSVGRYIVSLLDRLGYRAKLKWLAANETAYNPFDSRQKIQDWLGVDWGFAPTASELIGPAWTSCQSFVPDSAPKNGNLPELCDPRLDTIEHSALAAQSTNPADATALWAKADRRLTNDAAYLTLATPSTVDFVSDRVGNYQYNPQLGVLLDQLWVR
jgi:YVTN family beta-propeller protein